MNHTGFKTLAAGLLICAGAVAWVHAAEKEADLPSGEEVTAERQAAMQKVDKEMKSLEALMAEGPGAEGFDESVVKHARIIAAFSHQIPELFPEGSTATESRAKPEVWDEREDFEEAAEDLDEKITAFVEAVESGDREQIVLTYRRLDIQNACAACHARFRAK